MPARPYDRWRDADGTPIPAQCRTEQIAVGKEHGALDAALHLSARTVAWLAGHPQARRFVGSVGDKLTELERSGHHPGALDALRRVLTHHQPTSAGRCRTCPRVTGRRRPFPCIVWHQIHCGLLGLVVGAGHRDTATGR